MSTMPPKITGPNAGGPCPSPIRTPLAARVGQFRRWGDIHTQHMRTTVFTFFCLALFLFAEAGVAPKWGPTITLQRIDDRKQIEGYWALSANWTGWMGLALELRNGQFRYWSISDVEVPGQPRNLTSTTAASTNLPCTSDITF